MDKSDMLIDFNSPAHKNEFAQPLIPVPMQIPTLDKEVVEVVVESCDDPFEVQETFDPFEVVLKQTTNEEPKFSLHSTEKILVDIHSEEESTKITSSVENIGGKEVPVPSSPKDNVLNITPLVAHSVSKEVKIPEKCKVDLENSHVTEESKIVSNTLKDPSKSSVKMENDSQSHISTDFSTEESLKAVIARRVNRCIQEVLNGSMKTKKDCDNSMFSKPQNKRSLSFIGLSSASSKTECDRLNKSCTDVNDSFNLGAQQLDVSNDSSGFRPLSPNSSNGSTGGNENNIVFQEARKLSRTFSKLADSFRLEQESDSENEDLMSCKPRWLYTDSSEDEEEKLLKDPSLNLRRRSEGLASGSPACAPHSVKVMDSPALLAYKSRRSFTNLETSLDNTQEQITMKRSISTGLHLKEMPVIPSLITTGPVKTVQHDTQPLKLKKNTGDVKKGPLRAVLPVQSMTKGPLLTGTLSLKHETSPEERIKRSILPIGTPIKDNSQLNIPPIASSTPNKDESFGSSKVLTSLLAKPAVTNKRHSLEGNLGSHKSREKSEGGTRPRSSSVNSSIPRVQQVKPLRSLPVVPKSTSSLSRAPTSQVNASNVPEKKTAQNLKTNVSKARVLTDVKTKSPRQGKIRTAVNTISNLVKGKKTAGRDKENRVPA